MPRRLLLLLLWAGLTACAVPVPLPFTPYTMGDPLPPPAPDVPTTIDPAYCATPGADLLAPLEGSWNLVQQEGTVWGATDQGSIRMGLPGHPAAPVTFEYAPDEGVVYLRSADLSDEMILFPATGEQAEAVGPLIGSGQGGAASSGCDWYDTPLFIGTNVYGGYDAVGPEDYSAWLPACALVSLYVPVFDPESCRRLRTPSEFELEMEMTLVVRFSDSGTGSGMLYFDGTGRETELGPGAPTETTSEFRARAPVKMSR